MDFNNTPTFSKLLRNSTFEKEKDKISIVPHFSWLYQLLNASYVFRITSVFCNVSILAIQVSHCQVIYLPTGDFLFLLLEKVNRKTWFNLKLTQ